MEFMHLRIANLRSGIFAVLLLTFAGAAHADSLTLRVVETHSGWFESVAWLRDHGEPELRAVHVQALDERGEIVACRDYHLELDANAKKAFPVGNCDPVSNATELGFAGRHHLFSRAAGIAQPILPSVVAARPPLPPAPPPAPPLPPPLPTTCWALVGPQIVDPETGKRQSVSPSRVALDFAVTATARPQTVAFDQAWLVRVPKSDAVTALGYALVPWHIRPSYSKSAPSMVLTPPPGLQHVPLTLRCDGDPLGNQSTSAAPVVHNRIETVDQFGAPLTLRRARSDGSLFAQQLVGVGLIPIGALALFGAGMTAGTWERHPRGQAIGGSFVGVAAGLVVGGLLMYYRGRHDLILRRGTTTVSFDPAHLSLHF